MKKITSTLILFIFLLASFQEITITILYHINQNYIAEVFCINKDEPELKCDGKCHLSQVIAQSEEAQDDEPISVNRIELLSCILVDQSK